MLVMPYQHFDADVLDALLLEIVSREGTDYGEVEVSAAEQVLQIKQLLAKSEAFICFESITESCTIISKQEAVEQGLLDD